MRETMDLRLLTVTVNYGELDKDEQVCNNNNSFVNLNNGDQNNKTIHLLLFVSIDHYFSYIHDENKQ
jgi:hypothetical protein